MAIVTENVSFKHLHDDWVQLPLGTQLIQNRSERWIELQILTGTLSLNETLAGIKLDHLEKFKDIPAEAKVYVRAQYNKELKLVLLTGDCTSSCMSGGGTGGGTTPTSNQPPVIALAGDNPQTVVLDSTYTEPGYVAGDMEDGDITANVITTGTVDTSTLGTNMLTYAVTDSGGASDYKVRVVTVVSAQNQEPVLTVLSYVGDPTPLIYEVMTNGDYYEYGATATDQEDGDITSSIIRSGQDDIDTSTIGDYPVQYSVTDSDGGTATGTRVVQVRDVVGSDGPPVLTVTGANPVEVEQNTTYTDEGATAVDGLNNPLTVDTTNYVDTAVLGEYQVIYHAVDGHGNHVYGQRLVEVVEEVSEASGYHSASQEDDELNLEDDS